MATVGAPRVAPTGVTLVGALAGAVALSLAGQFGAPLPIVEQPFESRVIPGPPEPVPGAVSGAPYLVAECESPGVESSRLPAEGGIEADLYRALLPTIRPDGPGESVLVDRSIPVPSLNLPGDWPADLRRHLTVGLRFCRLIPWPTETSGVVTYDRLRAALDGATAFGSDWRRDFVREFNGATRYAAFSAPLWTRDRRDAVVYYVHPTIAHGHVETGSAGLLWFRHDAIEPARWRLVRRLLVSGVEAP